MKKINARLVVGFILAMCPVGLQASPLDDAETLIQNRQFDAALAKFSSMPRAESDQVLILRLEGVCYLKLERYPEAERTLKAATQSDPTNVASRFYLAQTMATEGKVNESIPLLERVLADAPDSEYGNMSRKILPALRNLVAATPTSTTPPDSYSQNSNSLVSQPSTKRWSATLSVSGAYDDNINENQRTPSSVQTQRGFSFVTSDELSVAMLDEKLDDAPMTIRATYDFYQNIHMNGQAARFDITTHDGAISFEKTVSMVGFPTKFYASGGYRNESQGGSKFDDSYTGAGSVATTWNSWLSTTIYDSYGQYNYAGQNFFPSLFDRTGGVNRVGFYPIFSLFGGKWQLQPVYEYNDYATAGVEFRATGHTVGLTSRASLPYDFTLITGFQWQNEEYSEFVPNPKRDDNIYDISASISHPIVIPQLNGSISEFYETTDSSQPFACYSRNVISVGVSYTY